jgi:hypothetical protein
MPHALPLKTELPIEDGFEKKVSLTGDRPGPRCPLPLDHLPGENRQTMGRIGEDGLGLFGFRGAAYDGDHGYIFSSSTPRRAACDRAEWRRRVPLDLLTEPVPAKRREQGLARAGNARVRRGMIQLASRFLLFQKESALARWYRAGTADSRAGTRKTMIPAFARTALARKLLIALWRFVTTGETLEVVILRPAG